MSQNITLTIQMRDAETEGNSDQDKDGLQNINQYQPIYHIIYMNDFLGCLLLVTTINCKDDIQIQYKCMKFKQRLRIDFSVAVCCVLCVAFNSIPWPMFTAQTPSVPLENDEDAKGWRYDQALCRK